MSGIPLCLLSRAANIFPLAYIANKFRSVPIPYSVQMMQFMCGLRGTPNNSPIPWYVCAIFEGAVAYALSAYLSKINPSAAIESGTLVIVVLSTIFFGGGTGPLMRLLRLQVQFSSNPISRAVPLGNG